MALLIIPSPQLRERIYFLAKSQSSARFTIWESPGWEPLIQVTKNLLLYASPLPTHSPHLRSTCIQAFLNPQQPQLHPGSRIRETATRAPEIPTQKALGLIISIHPIMNKHSRQKKGGKERRKRNTRTKTPHPIQYGQFPFIHARTHARTHANTRKCAPLQTDYRYYIRKGPDSELQQDTKL